MASNALVRACADHIHDRFNGYRQRFEAITRRAPDRFMARRWAELQADAGERLDLYAEAVDQSTRAIDRILGDHLADEALWRAARPAYARRIAETPDRDLAETFFNSVTRRILRTIGVNRHIEFVHDEPPPLYREPAGAVHRTYFLADDLERLLSRILADYQPIPFDEKNLVATLPRMADRLHRCLADRLDHPSHAHIEMIAEPFYRGQGAYLIGRIVDGDRIHPIVMALLHPPGGVIVDALILDTDAASIVFSYTRSAFHIPLAHPGVLVDFLQTILPAKPTGEIYSAIGCFKHGKTVLYQDVCRYTAQCTEDRFRIAPGKRGMVMVVFDMAGYDMVVKLIRDRFENPKKTTRAKVKAQYDFVFKHYRVGRLIEAHAFDHLSFDRCWFTDELLDCLLSEAGQTVHLMQDRVIIAHAYLERRVTPLDIYLQAQPAHRTAAVVVDFGNAIKDLALANIFPGDMLLKNFGVTRHGRVVFYDYDEIVPLTECRFRRIPPARSHMEELADEPWYTVDENDVFPEEFSRFLGLAADHRDRFLHHHAELLTTDYWTAVQADIRRGHLRHIRPYRPEFRLTIDS